MRTHRACTAMSLALGLLVSGCAKHEPPAGGLFDVGGHKLYLECAGSGAPTIVLDHGQGTDRKTWDKVWPDLIKTRRACRYDRAGRGDSEPGPTPTTSARIVSDLHALLAAGQAPPPYVMVGHSFGGLNAQLFAHTYPSEVVGLVLIDSSSRDYDARAMRDALPDDPTERRLLLDFLPGYEMSRRNYTTSPEGVDWESSLGELSSVTDFGDLPLYVLTAGDRTWTAPAFFPPQLKQRFADLWMSAQTKLAARSRRSTHVVVEGTGHFVHDDRPDMVMKAVKAVLENR